MRLKLGGTWRISEVWINRGKEDSLRERPKGREQQWENCLWERENFVV